MAQQNPRAQEALSRVVAIMARLRSEQGCPWDREQDLRSLRPFLLEEAYEVLDEMDRVGAGGPWKPLCEELGDLLFQIVFHAQLAQELGEFDMEAVCDAIANKIVSRHPHVFGDRPVTGADQVLQNWAKLKADERRRKQGDEGSALDGVPSAAPALLRAERLTEKASRVGFDWPNLAGVRAKLDEELAELDEAIASGDRDALEHELGDVLFSLANVARFIRTPPEDALRQANHRFTRRFRQVEAGLRGDGVPFGEASLEQMEHHWEEAKAHEGLVPKPLHTAAPALSRVELAVASLGESLSFWQPLALELGWPLTQDERSFWADLPQATLCWHSGPTGPSPALGITLELGSRKALADLERLVTRAGASVARGDGRIEFRDPDGYRWAFLLGEQLTARAHAK